MHYQRLQKTGTTTKCAYPATCTAPGCDKPHYALGLCATHRARKKRADRGIGPPQSPARDFLMWALVQEQDECILWAFGKTVFGYGAVEWEGKKIGAHRAMCILAYGPPPFPRAHAAHARTCPNRSCINKRHLRWATPLENMEDRGAIGKTVRGEKMHFAKLTEQQALAIYSDDRIAREVAADHGCSVKTVESIWQGVHWGWLTGHSRSSPSRSGDDES